MSDGEEDDQVVEVETGDEDEDQAAVTKPEGEEDEAAAPENDDDEMVVEIEGITDPPVEETPVIRTLRERERALARRVKELEGQQQATVEAEVGPEPDLWSDEIEGDAEKYKAALMDWNTRKAAADSRRIEAQQAEQNARQRFDTSLQAMRTNAAKLGVSGYAEAEEAVGAALPPAIGNAIPVYFGERAPALVKALHAHPAILEKITTTAKTDLVQALFDLWDLSKGVKMVPKRKTGAQAEEIVRGSAPLSAGVGDKKLEEMEKKAARTGDRSEIVKYKQTLRAKAA